jgi:hypothetical protein
VALRPRFSPGLPLSAMRNGVPAPRRQEQKNRRASPSLSRFRDLLPSRHRRPYQQLASGFIASEVRFNMERNVRGARIVSYLLALRSPVDHVPRKPVAPLVWTLCSHSVWFGWGSGVPHFRPRLHRKHPNARPSWS